MPRSPTWCRTWVAPVSPTTRRATEPGGCSGLPSCERQGEVVVAVGPGAFDGEAGRAQLVAQLLGAELRRDLDPDLLPVCELESEVGPEDRDPLWHVGAQPEVHAFLVRVPERDVGE